MPCGFSARLRPPDVPTATLVRFTTTPSCCFCVTNSSVTLRLFSNVGSLPAGAGFSGRAEACGECFHALPPPHRPRTRLDTVHSSPSGRQIAHRGASSVRNCAPSQVSRRPCSGVRCSGPDWIGNAFQFSHLAELAGTLPTCDTPG